MSQQVDTLFTGRIGVPPRLRARRSGRRSRSRGGRIAAVGPDAELAALAGPDTDVVDLAGGLLLPGFQDAHVHPVMGGLAMLQCELHGDDVRRGVPRHRRRVRRRATRTSSGSSAVAGRWSSSPAAPRRARPSTRSSPTGRSTSPTATATAPGSTPWRSSWPASTRRLRTRQDGRIERDADGTPDRRPARGRGRPGRVGCSPTPATRTCTPGLLAAQELLFSLGITAWQDAAVGRLFGLDDIYPIYLTAARSGDLKARVVGALWWERDRGAEQIPELVARRAEGRVGRFAATSVKIMQDGVAENFTAAMLEPYLDTTAAPPHNSGLSFVDPVALRDHVTQLDAAGFQVHFHALGDRAVREALDAIEAARAANGPTDGRHHLAHLQVVHPDDVPRFARARRGRQHPAAVGRPRAADGRADHPVPRRAPGSRGSTRSATCCAPGLAAGGRQRLVGQQPQPARGHPRRGQPGRPGRRTGSRCTPHEPASRSPRRSRRTPPGAPT